MVTKEFREKQIPCTAIFAISDMLAIGAGKALSDAGYKVPEDISLAGFDGGNREICYPVLDDFKAAGRQHGERDGPDSVRHYREKGEAPALRVRWRTGGPGFYDVEDVRKDLGTKGMHGNTWF